MFITRQDLCIHSISKHDSQLRSIKAHSYRFKAGKLLANQLEEKVVKQKIRYIKNPKSGQKVTNPKDVADAFSDYYEALYNLKNDPEITTRRNHIRIPLLIKLTT